uniref:OGG_N domain-containing protein n=1 Tax=Angiostrongylus cantonensis TaxID=6313 RepID=A0A0K0D6S5_ANGCA
MSPNGMTFLNASVSQLNLKAVLMNGQSFRWRKIGDSYYGVVDGLLYYLRRFDDTLIEWRCLGRTSNRASTDASLKLHKYFQLNGESDMSSYWQQTSCCLLFRVNVGAPQRNLDVRIE